MDRTPVKCTLIKSVGYDVKARILEIEFIDGEIRDYLNVPEYIHQNLMKTNRKRIYFLSYIKNVYKDKIVNPEK